MSLFHRKSILYAVTVHNFVVTVECTAIILSRGSVRRLDS